MMNICSVVNYMLIWDHKLVTFQLFLGPVCFLDKANYACSSKLITLNKEVRELLTAV